MGAFLLFGDAFFVILCYNRGKNSSFLAPFPLFRTVAAVRNFYLLILYTTSYTKSRIKAPLTEQKNQKK